MLRESILLLLGAPLGLIVVLSAGSYFLARHFDPPDIITHAHARSRRR
jgi:hypothetical protein